MLVGHYLCDLFIAFTHTPLLPLQVFVNGMDGKPICVDGVTTSTLVQDFKNTLRKRCSTPTQHMRLNYMGREMQDEATFSSYNVSRDSTLHLLSRLPAGMHDAGSSSAGGEPQVSCRCFSMLSRCSLLHR